MKKKLLAAVLFGGIVLLAVAPGSFFNPGRGSTRAWYAALEKPSFNPPDWIFGPVWTALYILIALSGARVWLRHSSPERTAALRWWAVQLLLNALWSPLFFGAKMPGLALVNIVLMLIAIAIYMRRARQVDVPAAWMMTPYLAWVSFATLLNATIVRLNMR